MTEGDIAAFTCDDAIGQQRNDAPLCKCPPPGPRAVAQRNQAESCGVSTLFIRGVECRRDCLVFHVCVRSIVQRCNGGTSDLEVAHVRADDDGASSLIQRAIQILASFPFDHGVELVRVEGWHAQEVEHAHGEIAKGASAKLSTLASRTLGNDELNVLFDDSSARSEKEPANVGTEQGEGGRD